MTRPNFSGRSSSRKHPRANVLGRCRNPLPPKTYGPPDEYSALSDSQPADRGPKWNIYVSSRWPGFWMRTLRLSVEQVPLFNRPVRPGPCGKTELHFVVAAS